ALLMLSLDLSLTGLASRARGAGAAPPAMPAGALGIWWFDAYSATPRPHVPNALDTAAPPASFISAPRRLFTKPMFWDGGSGVIAEGVADPFSGNEAASFTAGGGDKLTPDNWSFPAGTYTLAVS